ncbi:hypothetical protein GCM10022244_42920 [Streptomyces gulbargensis]|uniref:Uncharacterized protein n=1 Tax=Streptomyces gulbargensis TaxID=364901 RepID=A0ABP7MSZ4_9ACTN
MPPTGLGKSGWRRRQLLTAARPTPASRAIPAAVTSVVLAPEGAVGDAGSGTDGPVAAGCVPARLASAAPVAAGLVSLAPGVAGLASAVPGSAALSGS